MKENKMIIPYYQCDKCGKIFSKDTDVFTFRGNVDGVIGNNLSEKDGEEIVVRHLHYCSVCTKKILFPEEFIDCGHIDPPISLASLTSLGERC
jgi:DNA-directed RNA polymerase subunit RPC12/RpoP